MASAERAATAVNRFVDSIVESGPWCVWMLCPDGRYARVIRFWRRRSAREFAEKHREYRLKVRTYWWHVR